MEKVAQQKIPTRISDLDRIPTTPQPLPAAHAGSGPVRIPSAANPVPEEPNELTLTFGSVGVAPCKRMKFSGLKWLP